MILQTLLVASQLAAVGGYVTTVYLLNRRMTVLWEALMILSDRVSLMRGEEPRFRHVWDPKVRVNHGHR